MLIAYFFLIYPSGDLYALITYSSLISTMACLDEPSALYNLHLHPFFKIFMAWSSSILPAAGKTSRSRFKTANKAAKPNYLVESCKDRAWMELIKFVFLFWCW